jgi:diketogulonate reductase-like aldo/keto reductase
VFAVAKTSTRARAVENRAALEIDLSADELERLDAMFPPPFRKVPLDMI